MQEISFFMVFICKSPIPNSSVLPYGLNMDVYQFSDHLIKRHVMLSLNENFILLLYSKSVGDNALDYAFNAPVLSVL